jgi:hypothetical protein
VQPPLSSPSDAHEREADRVADELVSGLALSPLPATAPGEQRLDAGTQSFFEARLDASLEDVRLHTGPDAGRAAGAVNARAFTVGPDVVFAPGALAPETEGRQLLAHELVHVVQQRGAEERAAPERLALEVSRSAPGGVVHRRPAELLDNVVFCGVTIGGGINSTLRDRLTQVQDRLQHVYDALGPNHADRVHFGGAQKTLGEWAEIRSMRGWRPTTGTSFHASGSAVDINYDLQPYIVTRTQVGTTTVYGGEAAGAGLQAERRAAADVYDRAVQFVFGAAAADVSARRPGETTTAVYQRFSQASRALAYYFRHAFLEEPTAVTRQPVANIETIADADLLAAIPTTERRPEASAVTDLDAYMDADFRTRHPTWTLSPRETYLRMLRDYEHVRIPMQRGNPSASPTNTRNPTRGFLHLKQEVVDALVDVGHLRWGAADFGAHSSGDVHHFDLGNHGGVVPDGTP